MGVLYLFLEPTDKGIVLFHGTRSQWYCTFFGIHRQLLYLFWDPQIGAV